MRITDETKRWAAVLGASGALLAGAFALPALAQDSTGTASEDAASEESTDGDALDPREHMELRQDALAEALAGELGLSVDEVGAALEAAHETVEAEWAEQRMTLLQERLDAAVADGQLTQEQADAIVAAAEEGVIGGPGMGGPHFGHGMGARVMPGPGFSDEAPAPDAS